MTFDIFELLEKGFTTFVAVLAVVSVIGFGRIITKHLPKLLESGREFIGVWSDFVKAMDSNAIAINKNTVITDKNHKHSEIVLEELKEVNRKFIKHDMNALDVKDKIEELISLIKEEKNSEEILELLQFIINKLEKEK